MIPAPITIKKNAAISQAIELMKENAIRHLPVVSQGNRLMGFVTLADLKQGLIPSMMGDVSLEDLMIKNPITVHPEDDVEIAARLIYEHKIGGMPVVEGRTVVGILTESDILRTFIHMMGILTNSSRIDVTIGDEPGALKKVLQVIHDCGGEIINVGQAEQISGKRVYYFRLSPCQTHTIKNALEKNSFEVLEAMD